MDAPGTAVVGLGGSRSGVDRGEQCEHKHGQERAGYFHCEISNRCHPERIEHPVEAPIPVQSCSGAITIERALTAEPGRQMPAARQTGGHGALRRWSAFCIVEWHSMERAMSERRSERREPVTVNFKREQLADLRRLADQEDRSLAQQVRHLVAKGLEATYEVEAEPGGL
jgi:hypothetical protein